MSTLRRIARRAASAQRGSTLAETIVAIGILTLALTMVGLPLSAALSRGEEYRADLAATATLRRASGLLAGDAFNAETISVGDGSPPADSLTVDFFDVSGQPHNVSYALSGTKLVRTTDGVGLVVARGVNTVAFSRSANLLTFELDVQASSGTSDAVTSYYLLRKLP